MRRLKFEKLSALFLSLIMLSASMTACSSSSEKTETVSTVSDTPETASGESALLQEIKKRGYILIGSSNDAPFCYQDIDTGKLEGIDIDILREICNRLGIADIQMKVIDFSSLLVELNNSNIDMVADAMYVKPERLQIAAFTDKWYQEGEAVVIPANSDITGKDDLKGRKVGAQPGTTFYETAQLWLEQGRIGQLIAYDSQATLMTAVNMGKIDAVVTDGIVAGYTLSKDSSLKLKLLSPYEAESSGQIGAAVRFTDKDFLMEINNALNEMKKDGTLLKILKDYGLTEDYLVDAEEGITTNIK